MSWLNCRQKELSTATQIKKGCRPRAVVDFGDPSVSIRGRRCKIVVSAVCRLQGVVLVVEGDVVNLLEVAI